VYPAGGPQYYPVYAVSGEIRRQICDVHLAPLPAGVSDFGAIYGTFPGNYDRDYFYTSNWGYAGEVTVLDGGEIEVGSEVVGEIAAVTQRVRYTLNLTADTMLDFSARGRGPRYDDTLLLNVFIFDPAVYIFDTEGKLLEWNDGVSFSAILLGKVEARLETIPLKAGTYWIEVGGSNDLVSGPFKLTVQLASKPSQVAMS
jgi:hypothetical protein